jgi:hypothetical protein
MEANHTVAGGAIIDLTQVPGGIITLSIAPSGADDEATGDLNITGNMTLVGAGAATTIIDGGGTTVHDRVLSVNGAVTVNISGVTIRNGKSGGIFTEASLHLTDVTVTGNSVAGNGAGIKNAGGSLFLKHCTVNANSANGEGGGIENLIGGASVNHSAPSFDLNESVVSNNVALNGGGIDILDQGAGTIDASVISANSALTLTGDGGGLRLLGGAKVVVRTSTLFLNVAGRNGGGIAASAPLVVENTTISGNSSGGDGGGIWASDAADVSNATITNNQADVDLNSTGAAGGVFQTGASTFFLANSIVWGNSRGGLSQKDCGGTFNLRGTNLILQGGRSIVPFVYRPRFPSPIHRLGPLAANGGPTATHALLPQRR